MVINCTLTATHQLPLEYISEFQKVLARRYNSPQEAPLHPSPHPLALGICCISNMAAPAELYRRLHLNGIEHKLHQMPL